MLRDKHSLPSRLGAFVARAVRQFGVSEIALRRATRLFSRRRFFASRAREALFWCAAATVAWAGSRWTQPSPAGPGQLVWARTLEAGEVVTLGDLDRDASLSEAGGVEAENLGRLEGHRLAGSVQARQAVRWTDIDWTHRVAGRIPKGYLAYPLWVPSALVLGEGDRVDIFVLASGGGGARRLVSDVLVLEQPSPAETLVALSDAEIRLVETASQTGKLKLAARAAHDRHLGPRSSQELPLRRIKKPAIQILEEED